MKTGAPSTGTVGSGTTIAPSPDARPPRLGSTVVVDPSSVEEVVDDATTVVEVVDDDVVDDEEVDVDVVDDEVVVVTAAVVARGQSSTSPESTRPSGDATPVVS